MDIRVKREAKGLVVSIVGRLDAVSAVTFDQEMDGQINGGECRFILDLSQLDYISSAGLRSILSLSTKLEQHEGTMTLCGLRGGVKEVFDISGFSTLFKIDEQGQGSNLYS